MLVLSRKIGESVVIDDLIVLTVAIIGEGFIDLGMAEVGGAQLGTISLDHHGLRPIVDGVKGVMVRIEGDRVRIGFDYREGVSIVRPEVVASPQKRR